MIPYAMLYAAAVGVPILLAALVASAFLRRHGRAERGVWAAALLLALALPAIGLASTAAVTPVGPRPAPVPVAGTGLIGLPAVVAVPGVGLASVRVARGRVGLDGLLIGLWLLASLVFVVRWAVAARRLALRTRGCPAEIVDGVHVWLTPDLGPAVAGWLRPRILAPSWLMSLPRAQRSLVLMHEEEHVRARDPVLFAAARVARILAPWNPAVWLLSSRLLRAVELDCDRRVLRRRPDVRAYGTTLLAVSSRDPGALVGAAAFAESEAPLRGRILAMTTPQRTLSVLGLAGALGLGILLLLGALEVPIPRVLPFGHAASALPSGTLAGTIRDAVSEEPIEHVQVFLRGTGIGTLTNAGGRFLLLDVPAGEHEVVAQLIGYGEQSRSVEVAGGVAATVDFGMQEVAVHLERVLVTGAPAAPAAAPPERAPAIPPTPPGRPIFTPYTVPPRVLNLEEVRRATWEAYPPELRAAGIGGTVEVYFFVTEDGTVADYRIDAGSGHGALDDAALRVAGRYRFSPALNRDARRAVWVAFPITFRAEG